MRNRRILLPACLALLAALFGVQAAWASAERGYVHERVREQLAEEGEARVIVTMWDSALPQAWARDWQERGGAIGELVRRVRAAAPRFRLQRQYEIFPFLAGTVDAAALEQLRVCPAVEGVYPDRKLRGTLYESGPLIGQPEAEAAEYDGTDVGVAILDSGIDYSHPDLGGTPSFPNAKVVAGRDIINNDSDPMDDNGHGTTVAGAAAGTGPLYRGIAPKAHLLALKVLDANGEGTGSGMIAGIEWCITNRAAHNIKVVNLSLGDSKEHTDPDEFDGYPETEAIQDAVAAGMVVVAAAGNEGYLRGLSFPACVNGATSVGATMDGSGGYVPADGVASFSDRGELLDLFAPGVYITSAAMGGGYRSTGGTSFAAPHVSGAAACLASKGITDPATIVSLLRRSGEQIIDGSTGVATPRVDLVGAMSPPSVGPDLVVTAVSCASSSGFVGDTVNVSLTVQNQGNTASEQCTGMVLLSRNAIASPQDYLLVSVTVPGLTAGASYATGLVAATVPGAVPGTYTVGAFADDGYVVAEIDETNNSRTASGFEVKGSTSRVVTSTIPEFMLKGQTYSLSVSMENDGTVSWTTAQGYELAAVSPVGTTRWGVSRVALPGGTSVPVGGTVTFDFEVTAPTEVGWHPCHWQMARGAAPFGEVAMGATKTLVVDDATAGQDYPAINGNRVAYEDYSGQYGSSISVTNLVSTARTTIPDEVPLPIDSKTGYPLPPYEWFDVSYHWLPDIWSSWVAWMVDDVPSNPNDPQHSIWYLQIAAYDVAHPSLLPRRITYQKADALYPAIEGERVVWEDYRNDPDKLSGPDFLLDNADIYIYDIASDTSYPLCTATGPQLAPRVSGDLVVWEDWRDGYQADLYLYDLSVDSDDDGTPNWQESPRPSPDPAVRRLTSTAWPEEFPDICGRTVVWMDLRRDSGWGDYIDIYAMDVDSMVETAVATDPQVFRFQPRIDDGKVVWSDLRLGQFDTYWYDMATGTGVPIAGSAADEYPTDISGRRVTYARYRRTVGTPPDDYDVYNVWVQKLPGEGSTGVHTFTDVTNDFWAWKNIEAAVEHGVVRGFKDKTYRPAVVVNRDAMAVYIANALTATVPTGPAVPTFPEDVPTDWWAYDEIEYCHSQDIVFGYGEGRYKPTVPVKRGQMAMFIGRAMAGGESFFKTYVPPPDPIFPDVRLDNEAMIFPYVQYIALNDVVKGYPDGLYHPERVCTRDQMAVYVTKAFGYAD